MKEKRPISVDVEPCGAVSILTRTERFRKEPGSASWACVPDYLPDTSETLATSALLEYSYWLYAPSASMSTSHDVMVKLVKQTHPSSLLGLEWKVSDCCLCTPFCTVTLTSQCENEGNTLGDWPRCGLNKGGSFWKHVDFCCICHDRKINTNCTAMGIQWPSLPMYPVSP